MAISKITYKASPSATPETWMDVTQNTVTPGTMMRGVIATMANGLQATGVYGEEMTISTDGAVTQALDAGKIYHFTGALTALTITLNATTELAQYHFDFNCGTTAPTVTLPNTVVLPNGNSFDANNHYEVDILNNYGAVLAWANS